MRNSANEYELHEYIAYMLFLLIAAHAVMESFFGFVLAYALSVVD